MMIQTRNTGTKNSKAVLVVILLFVVVGVIMQVADDKEADQVAKDYKTDLVVESISAQEIGTVYQGMEAQAGYRFYYINSLIRNNGKANADSVYNYYLTFYKNDGDNVIDVTPYPETDYDNPFSFVSEPCIPSGETGSVQQVVQVREGVDSITGDFYNYYRDKPTQYTIDIPEI
ncbi:hypothetical protein [uncultured Robinsoniella sp.]|uniref:hypothetical protein n=1 Tax=uncultured Robinsoniella sp. TaxID=904190 RepID=UPI00374F8818